MHKNVVIYLEKKNCDMIFNIFSNILYILKFITLPLILLIYLLFTYFNVFQMLSNFSSIHKHWLKITNLRARLNKCLMNKNKNYFLYFLFL